MFFRSKPSVLFFPINGSGLGHLNRCLAYARHLPRNWRITFFSNAAAIGPIEKMGFDAEYFVSWLWSDNKAKFWNAELALRLGLMLEHLRPDILVFDGTWPYHGLRRACDTYRCPLKLVWSRRGLFKDDSKEAAIEENFFDLALYPGEMLADEDAFANKSLSAARENLVLPPVTLFDKDEILPGPEARAALGLPQDEKLILFTLGSGYLKDMSGIGHKLLAMVKDTGFRAVWLQSPIALGALPAQATPLRVYPIAPYLKAFDGIIAAAGYNTCHEVAIAGIPTLFVPNDKLADNQKRRAEFMCSHGGGLVCSSEDRVAEVFNAFLALAGSPAVYPCPETNGAQAAATALRDLAAKKGDK